MEIDKNALKVQAYKEENTRLQEANADLRVELTVVSQQNAEYHQKIQNLTAEIEALLQPTEIVSEDIVEGEVVPPQED